MVSPSSQTKMSVSVDHENELATNRRLEIFTFALNGARPSLVRAFRSDAWNLTEVGLKDQLFPRHSADAGDRQARRSDPHSARRSHGY